MKLGPAIRRIFGSAPLWHQGNLLDQDILAEIHIIIPKDGGRPSLYTAKNDQPTESFVQVVVHAIVSSAIDWGRIYGVNVAGFLGQPACPHCGKVISGPAGPPPA
jgi:hypothetical protein